MRCADSIAEVKKKQAEKGGNDLTVRFDDGNAEGTFTIAEEEDVSPEDPEDVPGGSLLTLLFLIVVRRRRSTK